MVEMVLFHHVLGLTDGVRAFAERLRQAGHAVTVPDLFDGARFASIDDGLRHVEQIGVEQVLARGEAAVADLPAALASGGISLGAMPAQSLAQRRPGVRAVLLYEGGVPLSTFGGRWPVGLPVQIHAHADDDLADVPVLQDLARTVPTAELHLYPGSGHLFTDASLPGHDADAFEAVIARTLALLETLPEER